jgi:hypothetical protein
MPLTFIQPHDYAGARIEAHSGRMIVGAVFPGNPCRWSLFLCTHRAREGVAKSELAAKNALAAAWADLLRAADLREGA